jgi:hypothetical protein
LDLPTHPHRGAGVQTVGHLNSQTVAAKLHQRNFVAIEQELCLAMIAVRSGLLPFFRI